MDDTTKATIEELDRAQRSKELQMQGGTDLDTTHLDKPAGLERPGGELLGSERGEYGPLTTVPNEQSFSAPMDPSGDDPFIPGTGEARDDFDSEALLSDQEKHVRELEKRLDPSGKHGPAYEADQTVDDRPIGGTTDTHNDLTEDTSGIQKP